MTEQTLTQDGEALQVGDIVCFAKPIDAYEETALLVVRELKETRLLVSDQQDMLSEHNPGYVIPTRAILSADVLKVA